MACITKQTKNIYFARHGERIDFIDRKWTESAERPCDPPLSPYGLEQAHELGIYVAAIQPRITHIYVSPFIRTIQTAIEIAKELNRNDQITKIHLEAGFGELCLGGILWNERTLYRSVNELSEISKDLSYIDQDYDSLFKIDYYLQNPSESLQKFRDRLQRTLQHTLNLHSLNCNILIVTHAATVIEGVRALLTISQQQNEQITIETNDISSQWNMSPIRAGVCSLTHVELIDNKWAVQKNGLASYLFKGEQNVWVFPDDRHLYKFS